MTIIDLSHEIEPNMTVYPGTPRPQIEPLSKHDSHGYAELQITFTTHTGTHLDVPYHVLPQGRGLDQMSLGKFMGKAFCVDVRGMKAVTVDFLKQFGLNDIDFLIFYTGMSKYWKTGDYLTKQFAVLTEKAANYLVRTGLKGVGLDAISIDRTDSESLPIHRILLSNEVIIVENLTNLSKLIGKKFEFFAMPLKIKAADGSPVRAIAVLDE